MGVVFERLSYSLREFDMVFVQKDYDAPVIKINTIPMKDVEMIRRWLGEMSLVWYQSNLNLAWPKLMKQILSDGGLKGFVEAGGCDAVLGEASDDELEAGGRGEAGEDESAE